MVDTEVRANEIVRILIVRDNHEEYLYIKNDRKQPFIDLCHDLRMRRFIIDGGICYNLDHGWDILTIERLEGQNAKEEIKE